MNHLKALSLLTIGVLCLAFKTYSQNALEQLDANALSHSKFFEQISSKNKAISSDLRKKTAKYLFRMSRLEAKMRKKMENKDSTAARRFDGVVQQYTVFEKNMSAHSGSLNRIQRKYVPRLDTLQTVLNFFLDSDGHALNQAKSPAVIRDVMKSIEVVQTGFSHASEINSFIQQRKAFLLDNMAKYGLNKEVRKLTKQAYYYQAQLNEYRKLISNPSGMETVVIESVKRTAVFKEFFAKHAQVAGLFRLPDNSLSNFTSVIEELQTRDGIGVQMIQRFGNTPDVQQMMHQKLNGALAQFGQLKEKAVKAGGFANNLDMPDFKPNNQKTKTLRQRLELGANLQTVKSNRFFPSTSDIGLSIGYKLNDKSVAGIGGSYKVGLGKSIKQISITHEGIGFRSFLDYKIKGGFWASGGAEINYRKHFRDFDILNDYAAWQKSALLGISRKYQVSKKFKGNIQFLYDFLWKQQVVRGQPVVFRVGYTL